MRKKCEHSNKPHFCRECKKQGKGGASLCDHYVQRSYCVPCGGSQVCEHKRHRKVCKECGGSAICIHGRQRPRCKECRPIGAFKQYVRNAERRGFIFVLSFEDYTRLSKQPCFYCDDGTETSGIDRVDSILGYTKDNCVPCCEFCNRMKMAYSQSAFIQQINRIANNLSAKPQRIAA